MKNIILEHGLDEIRGSQPIMLCDLHKQAIDCYDKCIAIGGGSINVTSSFEKKFNILIEHSQIPEAYSCLLNYEQYLKSFPNTKNSLFVFQHKANIEFLLENYNDCLKNIEKYIKIDPGKKNIEHLRLCCIGRVGIKDEDYLQFLEKVSSFYENLIED